MQNTAASPDVPPLLSVVVPAYNETGRIGPTLQALHEYLYNQQYTFEVILVDDGSRDATLREALAAWPHNGFRVLRQESNQGKGAAVRRGMLEAHGDFRLFTDADNSTPIGEIEKLWPHIRNGYHVVIGSRAMRDSDIEVHQPFYRENMGRLFNLVVQSLVLYGIRDTQCGFKLFTREAAVSAFEQMQTTGFAFDVEALLRSARAGFRIKEVGIHWENSPETSVSMTKHGRQMLKEVLTLRKLYKRTVLEKNGGIRGT